MGIADFATNRGFLTTGEAARFDSMNDSDYIRTAKRVYEEENRIEFDRPEVERKEGGAWVTARVWVDDEWCEDSR